MTMDTRLAFFLAVVFYGWIFATFLSGVINAARSDIRD